MIKAVVFDLDDTLISEKQYVASGFSVISKNISKKYNLSYEEVNNKILQLFKESAKEVFNRLLESFDIKYTKEDILKLIKIYREHTPVIDFYDDVIPTITKLKDKGYKLGIITDGYKETQLAKISVLNCREFFDEIIVTDELGREFWKPHEKAYKLMAEKLGINHNEMIYVGDNEEKDFITANNMGVRTIKIIRPNRVYNDNEFKEHYLAKYEISNLDELFKYID